MPRFQIALKRNLKKWIKRNYYILPPELNQIIMLYAEGYPEIKRVLPKLLKEIRCQDYVMLYTINSFRNTVSASRVLREDVYDDIQEYTEICMEAGDWNQLDHCEDTMKKVWWNRKEFKIVVYTPVGQARDIIWRVNPWLN